MGNLLITLAAVFLAAAPVWAEQAQDAAAAEIALLSNYVHAIPASAPEAARPMLPVEGIDIKGCEIWFSNWHVGSGPEGFVARAIGDLTTDTVVFIRYPGQKPILGLIAGPNRVLDFAYRDVADIRRFNYDFSVNPDAVMATAIADLPVKTAGRPEWALYYFDLADPDRLQVLEGLVDDYQRRWCQPGS